MRNAFGTKFIFALALIMALGVSARAFAADAQLPNYDAVTGQRNGYVDRTKDTMKDCGESCTYGRSNDNLTSQAAYLNTKIEEVTRLNELEDYQALTPTLEGFCITKPDSTEWEENPSVCADRYVKVHKLMLYDIQDSIRKNNEARKNLKTGNRSKVNGTYTEVAPGQPKPKSAPIKPYVPYMVEFKTLKEQGGVVDGRDRGDPSAYRSEVEYLSTGKRNQEDRQRYNQFQINAAEANDQKEVRERVSNINNDVKGSLENMSRAKGDKKKREATELEREAYIKARNNITLQVNKRINDYNNGAISADGTDLTVNNKNTHDSSRSRFDGDEVMLDPLSPNFRNNEVPEWHIEWNPNEILKAADQVK